MEARNIRSIRGIRHLTIKDMTIKEKKKLQVALRASIQILYFCFLPSAYTAAFAGVKYIFTRLGAGERLELASFTAVLTVLCAYTVVFGRFFCGFACAFGSLGDALHALYKAICKKLKKRPVRIGKGVGEVLSCLKYVILLFIAALCFAGVYPRLMGTSPWDVFSMLHARNFRLEGYAAGLIILILMMAGMCIEERFFCRFFCPMGAVFSLLPVIPAFALHRNREGCIKNCSACTGKCPSHVELPQEGSLAVSGECFQCQKCIGTCPGSNIHCGFTKLKGSEFWFTILRALLLLALMLWTGV